MFNLPALNIPIWIFLIVYAAYMLFYVFYSLFNVYHLIRYGIFGFGLYLIITIFTGGTIILFAGSLFLFKEYDWTTSLNLQKMESYDESLFPRL